MPSQTTENNAPAKPSPTDEIDLIEVFKKIWAGRKTIYISVAISFVIGIIIIWGTPNEYKSEITLLSETSSKSGGGNLGQLAGLAGIAGISLGSGTGADALTIDLYPDIVKSTPFLLEIMNQKVTESKTNKTITVAEYFDKYTKPSLGSLLKGYTIGLPGKLIVSLRKPEEDKPVAILNKKGPLKLSKEQSKIAETLKNLITINIQKSGSGLTSGTSKLLNVSIETQDPIVSAQLTDSVVTSLKHYIVDYYTSKAKKDLEFVIARYNESRDKYFALQQAYASHRDQNLNVILASVNTSSERLQTEVNLAASIYNTMAQQLEQAKLKVQEQTPVFTVIEPAKVALKKNNPQTMLILIAMIFLGAFLGVGLIFLRNLLSSIKNF